MTEFTVQLADCTIGVTALFESTRIFCNAYLTDKTPAVSVSVSPEDIAREREMSEAEDRLEGLPIRSYSDAYLETLAVYRKITGAVLDQDVFLMHGSVIEVDGLAYLFTAVSGTGKTTHTRLWMKKFGDRARIINGDKPLIRVSPEGVFAYGTPWQGKEQYGCNAKAPLTAICFLERSVNNHIREVTVSDELSSLLHQIYVPEDPFGILRIVDLVSKLPDFVRFYRLGCNMEDEAADVAYKGMCRNDIC